MASWLDDLIASGASGVNSVWLKRASDAGVIKPGMSADEIHRAVASIASPAPARQMELPLRAPEDEIRSLIPYGSRGAGVPSDLSGPGVAMPSEGGALIPAPMRGLHAPPQARIGTTGGQRALPAPTQKALPAPAAMRDQQAVDGIANQFDNVIGGRGQTADLQLAPYGHSGARAPSAASAPGGIPAWAKAAAGAGLVGAGAAAWNMMPAGMRPKESEATGELTSTDGTADLAAENRPAPVVEPSTSPRDQAQELIAKLNKMRRDAGGEVPEAPQMMKEINRLMALSNQQRNSMTPQQAQGSKDPHVQAQALIAQLNQMRQQAGGEVPQAQQIMAEVRRLQAMGDQQRNAAQTR